MEQTKSWYPYVPALVISLLILVVAGILGGPIAAAIAAMAVLPSLLIAHVLTFALLSRYSPATTLAAIGVGIVIYVVSAIAVMTWLSLFGPSQIM